MAVCARCRPGARGFGATCEPTRCPGSRIRGKKENNKVINKSQTPTMLPSALEYISALPLASPNNRPPLPVRRRLSLCPQLAYLYSTSSTVFLPMPDAPASPRKTVSSASQQVRSQKKPGAPKPKGAVRAKSGCYTCRIRRKVRPRGAHHPLSKSLTPISSIRVFSPSFPPRRRLSSPIALCATSPEMRRAA